MSEYIERDKFREELINTPFYPRCKTTPDLLTSVQDRLNDTLEILDNFPVADVKPVVRGCWVFNEEDGHCYCSECGGVSPMDDQNGDECDCPNYCPNCGADTREHEEKPKKDQFEGWSEELKETYRNLLANLNLEGGDAEWE